MAETTGERRAETARETDDSDIIEAAERESVAAPEQQGREGGNIQTDVGTQAELERATDPNAHESVTKGDHIAHGQGESPRHPAEQVVTERD
jgi:hypothetical protein